MNENTETSEVSALTLKVALSKFSLNNIPEIEELYEKIKSTSEDENLMFKIKSLQSTIYVQNNCYKESFEIDSMLIDKTKINELAYSTVINRLTKSASETNRAIEIIPTVRCFLLSDRFKFSDKILVLDWFYHSVVRQDSAFEDVLDHALNEITLQMGVKMHDNLGQAGMLAYLVNEYHRANKHLDNFVRAFRDASENERLNVVESFLAEEQLPPFRDRISDYLN